MIVRQFTGTEFEKEVRGIARNIWETPGDGSPIIIDGRERDCVFLDGDVIHYMECTISRQLQKVRDDSAKMVKFREQQSRRNRPVKLWFVTQDEPTADQVAEANKHGITALSLEQFKRYLFDAPQYLLCRGNYPFGSATNPDTDSHDTRNVKYQSTAIKDTRTELTVGVEEILSCLKQKCVICVTGDYGVGKSLLIREIFKGLEVLSRSSAETLIPVALNLRDHWGQSDPHEVLQRHATKIGFAKPSNLIRAYNSGQIVLLLDGFDEITTKPVSVRHDLRTIRKEATQVIREFISGSRGRVGLLVAGRAHFFDSTAELESSLGLRATDRVFSIGEFSDDEAAAFLKSRGYHGQIPDWLPRRPLLLAYLAVRGVLKEVQQGPAMSDPAQAWDGLVAAICRRESEIHKKHLDDIAIRNLLERLADVTRVSASGVGPVQPHDVSESFRHVTGGQDPDEAAQPLLMRLPGLSARNSLDGSRQFLDDNLLAVLRSGGVCRFIMDPYSDPGASDWQHGLPPIATDLVARKIADEPNALVRGTIAAREAVQRWNSNTLGLDIVNVCIALADVSNENDLRFSNLEIKEACTPQLDLSAVAPSELRLVDLFVDRLILPSQMVSDLEIRGGLVHEIVGASDANQIPGWMKEVEIKQFDSLHSNAAILRDDSIPLSVRVLLTILRKLYLQRGTGRKENALSRGLPSHAQRFVEPILSVLQSENLVYLSLERGTRVWHPYRLGDKRAYEVLSRYRDQQHSIIQAVADMTGKLVRSATAAR